MRRADSDATVTDLLLAAAAAATVAAAAAAAAAIDALQVLASMDGTIQLFGAATAVPSWTNLNSTADIGQDYILVNGWVSCVACTSALNPNPLSDALCAHN
jgi:hypothetical protein